MNAEVRNERRGVLKWVVAAAAVALVLLFTVVLPAEYGYDPTRIGRMLGLTALSDAPQGEENLDTVIDDLLSANDNIEPSASADPMTPLPLPNHAINGIVGSRHALG